MSRLVREFYYVQNPALGAYLLSRFSLGYLSEKHCMVPMPLLFIVLPIIYKREVVEFILKTQKKSGLRYFAEKFTDTKVLKNDLIIQIHNSSQRYKEMTLQALRIGVYGNLVAVQDGVYVLPLEENINEYKCKSEEIKNMAKASEKLGIWCSQLTLAEISQILKVRF